MVCDILDFKCIFVNELVGNIVLAVILSIILYFVIASRSRFGFDTTVVLAFPFIMVVGIAFVGFNVIYIYGAVFAGILLAWVFNRMIGN